MNGMRYCRSAWCCVIRM